MKERLIVALDVDEFEKAKKLVDTLYPTVKLFKVGSQLFTSCGVEIIRVIQRKGAKTFLDLKFHDIPNTVSNAVRAATRLGVFMLTIHTMGGMKMLKEASASAKLCAKTLNIEKPKMLGVTVLTSMDNSDLNEIGVSKDLKDTVTYLARLAKNAGLDGVIASAREIPRIKKAVGKNFIIVTPGIRPKESAKGDQKRIVTPADAIRAGADYIVIGRPITQAKDPKEAAKGILAEMENAKKE